MNWQQLYTASTPEERLDLLHDMVRVIEARQNRIILARGRLLRERRHPLRRWHIIGDRRASIAERNRRAIYKALFLLALPIISIATWTVAVHSQPIYGALLVLLYDIVLASILFIKPYKWLTAKLTT